MLCFPGTTMPLLPAVLIVNKNTVRMPSKIEWHLCARRLVACSARHAVPASQQSSPAQVMCSNPQILHPWQAERWVGLQTQGPGSPSLWWGGGS